MGLPKALVRLPNRQALLTNAIRILREGGCADIIVVIGAGASYVRAALTAWQDEIDKIIGDGTFTVVTNSEYEEGMSTSVRAGLKAVTELESAPDAVVVSLVDTPSISPDAVDLLLRTAGPAALAVATYDGTIGHPILIGREHWGPIADSVHGDVGARQYINGRSDLQRVVCDGLGSPEDIDTPEQMAQLAARVRSKAEVITSEVTQSDISVSYLELLVRDRRAGAVVTFSGIVRDHDYGRTVTALNYMAHPTADDVIKQIAQEVADASPARYLAVQHRVGPLQVGDIALGCAVAADHRDQAFEACSLLVERVKAELPVWKRQVFEDGTDEWVNAP